MERPGDGFTSADLVGAAGGVVEELTGSLRGWKRKVRRAVNCFLNGDYWNAA